MNNIKQLKKAMVIYHETYSPLLCPACGERYGFARNKVGVCDGCYVEDIVQRAVYSHHTKNETMETFFNWLMRTYIPEEEVDPTLPPEKRWAKEEG